MSQSQIGNTQFQYLQNQNLLYNTILPNQAPMIPANQAVVQEVPKEINTTAYTTDPYIKTREPNSILDNLAALFQAPKVPDAAIQSAQFCSQNTVDTLLRTQNSNLNVRCGWIYDQQSGVSQGAYGIQDGPFPIFKPPKGQWFWDLNQAKKRILTDKCSKLESCQLVGDQQFRGCGFCSLTNKGIPIDSTGNAIYKDDMRLSCGGGQILTNPSQCPRPAIPVETTTLSIQGQTVQVMTKDTILGLINKGGCSTKGGLYQTISASNNSTNYTDKLSQYNPAQIYNKFAQIPLDLSVFRDGTAQQNDILGEIGRLKMNMNFPQNSPLGASARDLCVIQGAIDNYDPCPDIPDNAVAPWDLQCLQANFRRLGGAAAGAIYPTNLNLLTLYNQFPNYGAIRRFWSDIKNKTQSTDYYTQRKALADFFGLNVP